MCLSGLLLACRMYSRFMESKQINLHYKFLSKGCVVIVVVFKSFFCANDLISIVYFPRLERAHLMCFLHLIIRTVFGERMLSYSVYTVHSTTVWVYSMRKRNRHEALQKQGDIFTVQGTLVY